MISGNTVLIAIVGTGQAAETLADDSVSLLINPTQLISGQETEIEEEKKTKTKHVDNKGNMKDGSVQKSVTITAKWWSINSNRKFPPTVYKGEEVLIYKNLTSNDYWWASLGTQDDVRGQESAIFLFSNLKDPSKVELDETNAWGIEISTKHQRARFHTANNNGEGVKFDMDFNVEKKLFTLVDNNGSGISLGNGEITIKTDTLNLEATAINVKASAINFKCSKATFDGDVEFKGKTKFNGGGETVTNIKLK